MSLNENGRSLYVKKFYYKEKELFVTDRNVMYNMHKESRSGNKKNEQFYERREFFQKTS